MSNRKYTTEQINFIRHNIAGNSLDVFTELFNKTFGTNYPKSTITATVYRYGCKNGIETKFNEGWEPTQFKKGHVPHNKGKKKSWQGGEETQFKPGHRPANYRPVGSERVNADGYLEVKISDPNKWKGKHLLIWEEAHGPVPKSFVVIFADGNRLNVTLDNLLMISRKELVVMNKRGLISSNAELTKVGVTIANLHMKVGERRRQTKNKKVREKVQNDHAHDAKGI